MKRAFLLVVFYIVCAGTAGSGEVQTQIVRIGLVSDTFAIIRLLQPMPTLPPCAVSADPDSAFVVSFDKSTQHGQDILALATTSLENHSEVKVKYSDTTCGWAGVRPLVTRIDIFRR